MDLCQQSNVSAFKLRLMGKLFYVASKLYFGLLCFLLILLNWQSRTTHININGVDSLNDVQHVRKHSQKPCKSIAESDPSLHLWMILLQYEHSKREKIFHSWKNKKDLMDYEILQVYYMRLLDLDIKEK